MVLSSDHRCSLLLIMAMAACYAMPLRAQDVVKDETQAVTEITQISAEDTQEWPILPGETLRGLAEQMYPENPKMQRRFLAAVMKVNRGALRGYTDDTPFTQPTLILLPKPEAIKIGSVESGESNSSSHSFDPARKINDVADSELVNASRLATPVSDKNAQDWPMLPGESLKNLAAQIYPKNKQMQRRFISAAQALNPESLKDVAPDTAITQAIVIRLPELRELSSRAKRTERMTANASRTAKPRLKTTKERKSFRVRVGAGSPPAGDQTAAAENLVVAPGNALSLPDASTKSGTGKAVKDQPGTKVVTGANMREIMDYDDLTARNLALKEEQERLDRRLDSMQAEFERLQQQYAAVTKIEASLATSIKYPKVVERNWFDKLPGFSVANLGLLLMLMLGIALPVWVYRRNKSQSELHVPVPVTKLPQPSVETEFVAEEVADTLAVSEPAPFFEMQAKETIPNKLPPQALEFDSNMGIHVESVDSVVEEARVLVAIGRSEQAIKMLNENILAFPKVSTQPWLHLLEIYRANSMQQEFSELAKRFHIAFNVITPTWELAVVNMVVPMSLEEFPHIVDRLSSMWGTQDAKTFLTSLIHDNRGGERIGFSMEVLKDILLLLAILDMRDFFRSDIVFNGRHGQ